MSEAIRAELARVAQVMGEPDLPFVLERPRDTGHGDLATNLAMLVARVRKVNPRGVAQEVVAALSLPEHVVSKVEIAGPGFINFWLAEDQLAAALSAIVRAGDDYGRAGFGLGERVNVEFVSANPTGPLHVGHGRGAALGDGIAALLEWTGHAVTREFYINDAGVQIDRLVESLWARIQEQRGGSGTIPEGGYQGEYLVEAAERAVRELPAALLAGPLDAARPELRRFILTLQREEQDALLRDFGVAFGVHTSEQAMYDEGRVAAALEELGAKGLSYEKDGALWFRSEAHGDDKDRVLRKSDGSFTYLVPDIAYHRDKHERGFARVIDVWGADHHGYIPRMRAVLRALGYPDDFFEVALVQLVKVVRGGEEVRMSKRAGDFVTLRDLLDWVGTDAARYFFLMRKGETPFVFDVDLARKQTDENPVFYVQMAHARMTGIFRVAGVDPGAVGDSAEVDALPAPEDAELLKQLTRFPEVVAVAARAREPHRITSYLEDLARSAHHWYHHCRVLGEPPRTEQARLVLARAARIVLANGLRLLGLQAPDRM
ncbi:MAG TPA: arginine--tRNA ligase [Gemmatimonadales bacterium]|nr:arginine--tRNA ligase [Gemmatimonadales bacterium]